MLPALAEADCDNFGAALYEFNALAGQSFAAVQGGRYASPRVAEVVDFVRQQGVRGVGQSSWGPGVFAVVPDREQASDLVRRLRVQFGLGVAEAFETRAWNQGALLTSDGAAKTADKAT